MLLWDPTVPAKVHWLLSWQAEKNYEVTEGSVEFLGKDLLELSPEERAGEGMFLAFQYPVEIPGLTTTNFIKTAVNEVRKYRGQEPLDAVAFFKTDERENGVDGYRSVFVEPFTE